MEALRLDTLAAQVVAWHNRHPLARRIAAAQVHSMGYVVLPGMQAQEPGPSGPGPMSAQPSTPHASAVAGADGEGAPGRLSSPLVDESAAAAAVPVDAFPDADAAPALGDPEPLAEAAPTLTTADAASGAKDEPPGEAPVVLPQATAVAATEPAGQDEADPAVDASLAGETAAAPSLRERLTSRPAQALPPMTTVAKPLAAARAPAPVAPVPAALPRTAAAALRLAFTERFFEHETPRRVADWALQQARLLVVRLPAGAAVRRVQRDPSLSVAAPGANEHPVDLLLRTATLEVGGRRQRLLIGPGDDPAVLGTRLWSLPRVAVACLPLVLLPLTAGAAWWLGAQSVRSTQALAAVQPAGRAAAAVVAPEPASAAEGAHALAADAHAVPQAAAAGHQPGASAAHGHDEAGARPSPHPQVADAAFTAFAASAAAPTVLITEPPEEAEPRLGRVELPPLGPLFSDPRFEPTMQRRLAARAARAAAKQAAAAQPAVAAGSALSALPSKAAAEPPTARVAANAAVAPPPAEPATTPGPPPAVAFALTTRPLRTAAESEQVQAAMRTLLALMVDGSARVQRVPVGDDWRVMGGPFVSRAAADKARAQLLARGVKTEVVEIPAAATVAAVVATGR